MNIKQLVFKTRRTLSIYLEQTKWSLGPERGIMNDNKEYLKQLNELENSINKIYSTVNGLMYIDPSCFYPATIKDEMFSSSEDVTNSINEFITTFLVAVGTLNFTESIESLNVEELLSFTKEVKQMLHDFKREIDIPIEKLISTYERYINQEELPAIIKLCVTYDNKHNQTSIYDLTSDIKNFIRILVEVALPRGYVNSRLTYLGEKIEESIMENSKIISILN